ncbi:DUF4365 domain-containing protein [Flavobacterium endoglycinae]|uniref:DUF4365 domain-containing protein n=1 Tax=Flavobacterium endoglycinae TaxID=2816357 RepID=A0ABX7QGU5_9FLAO|nr:DUF4365 domain-containing protein [Flavobacterium endoglycinae]QSW89589.1 DUF4365 domain-containing protein [Flavobacterium endoglycinae]
MHSNIINADSAPYPKTSTPEMDAVATLVHILDKSRLKPIISVLDKVPNIDGYIEIVNGKQQPLGKLEVQIKFLPESKTEKPKHQCELQFLAYCEHNILPVLLIVVDAAEEKAYWIHISRKFLYSIKDKIKANSVNIDIPKTNVIMKSDASYIPYWLDIINDYKTRLINFDSVSAQLDDMKSEHEKLKKLTNPALGIDRDYFKEIHFFLDYYNNLLEKDFIIIKEIFYPDCWKIGIAYSVYSDYVLSYSFYPISYTTNDIQIKEINPKATERLKDAINYIRHNKTNPIKYTPEKYAYGYIIQNLKKIVDSRMLLPINKYVANEYIVAFLDKNYEFTGIEKSDSYKIEDIKFALNVFIPFVCEEFLENANDLTDEEFDIDFFRWHLFPRDIKKLIKKVRKRIKENQNLQAKIRIYSAEFNLEYIWELIIHLQNINEMTVNRQYPVKVYPAKRAYFFWEVYDEPKVENALRAIFKNLPRLYDDFITEYFPAIQRQISFFSYFDWLIVNIAMNAEDRNNPPGVEFIYLKNQGENKKQQIDIFNSSEKSPLYLREIFSLRDLTLDFNGEIFKVVASNSSYDDNIYHDIPMQDYIYDTLKNRLETYLAPLHNGNSTIFKFTRY